MATSFCSVFSNTSACMMISTADLVTLMLSKGLLKFGEGTHWRTIGRYTLSFLRLYFQPFGSTPTTLTHYRPAMPFGNRKKIF